MAELDLYGDLYGDVDECGSPVALSPAPVSGSASVAVSAPAPVSASAPSSSMPAQAPAARRSPPAPAKETPSSTSASRPATFSISTYEDSAFSARKNDSPRLAHSELWQGEAPHPPRPSSAAIAHAALPAPVPMAARSALWGVKPSEMPDEGKMFVGGLNWETTEDALKQYFSQFGAVVHCTIMRDPTNGRSRGFAFLTFADPAVVNKVMVKEHFLDGKLIDPKRAIPRGTVPNPSGMAGSAMSEKRSGGYHGSDSASLSNKLFCRGMPEDATPQSFRAYWSQFDSRANIEEAVLMMDRDSNRHRGFGFVNLVTGEDADALLKCGPFVMDGHPLEVKRKAPSRARPEFREDLSKMAPAPFDRYPPPYGVPPSHDPGFPHGPMGGLYKAGMGGPGWKGWPVAMIPPMGPAGLGSNRTMYMGMGLHPDERSMGPPRMAHDLPAGMAGPFGAPHPRAFSGNYAGLDWRGGPPSMRLGGQGSYPTSYPHHPSPSSSGGPSRTQRGPRNYTPY